MTDIAAGRSYRVNVATGATEQIYRHRCGPVYITGLGDALIRLER